MQRILVVCLVTLTLTQGSTARGEPVEDTRAYQSISGTVISAQSRWNGRNDFIVTESVIRTGGGQEFTVQQRGGTVAGVGMVQFPGPRQLKAGDQVALEVQGRAADALWRVTEITSLTRPQLGFSASPSPASSPRAFVRTTTDDGTPLYWAKSCALLTYDSAGTSHLAGDREFQIADTVLSHWVKSTADCSYFTFRLLERQSKEVGFDGVNVLKFRDERWCRPATEEDPEECYEQSAAGLTTLFFVNDPQSPRNGEILDADIEINGVNFGISDNGRSLRPDRCLADLANTLTHEVGHLLGLDHTCRLSGEPTRLNNLGDPVPSCSTSLPESVREATMHASQTCGETKKATLETDDVSAACSLYPLVRDPGTCGPVDSTIRQGYCSISIGGHSDSAGSHTSSQTGLLWLLALALALVWRFTRSAKNLDRTRGQGGAPRGYHLKEPACIRARRR